jgi:hypothetical protein
MKDVRNTILLAAIAALSVVLAIAVAPKSQEPAFFNDQGEELYPAFKDPSAVASVEVVEWNENKAAVETFKVDLDKTKGWIIPSKFNYPANAEFRLGEMISGFMDLKKDRIRSDNAEDHAQFGVIDPGNPGGALQGIGRRVILRDAAGKALFDLIIGGRVKDHADMRYVRVPDSVRVYDCQVTDSLSTKFADWIKTDLLEVAMADITEVIFDNYSINEQQQTKVVGEVIDATGSGDNWSIPGLAPDEEVAKAAMSAVLSGIDYLKTVDVLPKPQPFSTAMRQGFFRDSLGNLVANQGELTVKTKKGITFKLYFGEVAVGAGGQSDEKQKSDKAEENRYLIAEAAYNQKEDTEYKPPVEPAEKETKEGEEAPAEGEKKEEPNANLEKVKELQDRFAEWIYVISDADYQKLQKSRADLVKKVEKPAEKAEEPKTDSVPETTE